MARSRQDDRLRLGRSERHLSTAGPTEESPADERGTDHGSRRAQRRATRSESKKSQSTARLWRDRIVLIAVVWAVWALVTTFLIQPFRIPSASMENTLQIGDRIVVSKLTPRFSDVHRGDVVVFKDPGDWTDPTDSSNAVVNGIRKVAEFTHLSASGAHLVKRVVGVGGDHVSCKVGGKLTVNGTAVTEPYVKSGQEACNMAFDITVPKDKVWVMGDNRGDSADSRFHDDGTGKLGSVPVDNITGKAVAILWPLNHIGGAGGDQDAFKAVPAAK